MNAATLPQARTGFLTGPLAAVTPDEVLAYFRSRKGISYFTVPDEAEVRRDKIDRLLAGEFEFLGETHLLPKGFDWTRSPSSDIEWHVMLHKFYYAVGLGMAYDETRNPAYVRRWIELTLAWMDSTPLNFLTSDVAGRRIQNWIFAHFYFVTLIEVPEVTGDFYCRFLRSLHDQVCWLRGHLTPARNHRTLELWAIFLTAVVFPEFQESAEWLEFSRAELLRNMQDDLLPDGVQCELSTDYHHIVLRNYLAVRRLAALNCIPVPCEMDVLIRKALDFAKWAHTPAGVVPAFSDGDRSDHRNLLKEGYGLYGDEEMLFVATGGEQGTVPTQTARGFRDSGYYVMRSGWQGKNERYLMLDCGGLGAGNHGHFDGLSFELAAWGRSLIVDPGRYTYNESGPVNWRVLFRSTAYHNTVLVNGKNQTRYEPRGRKFKVRGPAPDTSVSEFIHTPEFDYLHCSARSHEYPVLHERRMFFVRPDYWLVLDNLYADEEHSYDLLFHLGAEAEERVELRGTRVDSPNLTLVQAAGVPAALDPGFVSRVYGSKEPAPVVRFSRKGSNVSFCTLLYPYPTRAPELQMETIADGYRVEADGVIHEISTSRPAVSKVSR